MSSPSRFAASGARQRGFLLEVEAHLHDARDTRIACGDDPGEAEAAAIRAFGTAREVARAENRADRRAERGAAAGETVRLLLALATAGMVVVGIAGLLARVIASFGLMDAMYGLPANVVMPAASCAHWLAVQPAATTCIQAGTSEASDDLTMVYLAVGVTRTPPRDPLGGVEVPASVRSTGAALDPWIQR